MSGQEQTLREAGVFLFPNAQAARAAGAVVQGLC